MQLLIAIGSNITLAGRDVVQSRPTETQGETRRLLLLLLDKVYAQWIKDSADSLRSQSNLPLQKQFIYETGIDFQNRVEQEGARGPRTILEEFDDASRALLILGPPGVGKSTLLIELAEGLVNHARQDSQALIPVVIKLCGWTEGKSDFDTWLIGEMHRWYGVPTGLGRQWINESRLIFLLDGLDEVSPEHRASCAFAINSSNIRMPGLVVTCRTDQYAPIGVSLKLTRVDIHPLCTIEVEEFLRNKGAPLQHLLEQWKAHSTFQELARTPLMLSILVTSIRDEILAGATSAKDDIFDNVFDTYRKRMLAEKQALFRGYSEQQIMSWLLRLAQDLDKRKLAIFRIDEISSSWLTSSRELWTFYALLHGIGSFCFALFSVLIALATQESNWWAMAPGGLVVWYLCFQISTRSIEEFESSSANSNRRYLPRLNWHFRWKLERAVPTITAAIVAGGFALLVLWLVSGWLELQLERLFFRANDWQVFFYILLPLLVIFLCVLIVAGGIFWTAVLLFKTFDPDETLPRVEMDRSINTALKRAIGASLVLFVGSLVILTAFKTFCGWQFPAILTSAVVAPIAFANFGGIEALKHYAIRITFCLFNRGPFRYRRFLEVCSQCNFIERRGGGFMFLHPLMQTYFAKPSTSTVSKNVSKGVVKG